MSTFTYRDNGGATSGTDREFPLFDHPYNATLTNERAVEIPIALDFMARAMGRGLEVGNVLAHYFTDEQLAPRWVVDKYEEHAPADPLDVFAITGSFDWILSISTIEHVRHGDPEPPNPWGAIAAVHYMRGLLAPGGRMLITAGLGQNPTLDEWLHEESMSWDASLTGCTDWTVLTRERTDDPRVNTWTQLEYHDFPDTPVDYGPTHGANAVWIGEWVNA